VKGFSKHIFHDLQSFEFHLRGSKGRLGREILDALVTSIPNAVCTESTRFGGSYASLTSPDSNLGRVFILASGKATSSSSQLECDNDYSQFQQTLRALEGAFTKTGINCLVYISSGGSVYGSGQEIKLESSVPNPANSYAFHKLRQEKDVTDLAITYGAKLLIIRLANAFLASPKEPKGLVDSLLSVEPGTSQLVLYVNPESRKQYGLFGDYAQELLRSLSEFLSDGSSMRVQNIFSSNSYSVREIIEIVSNARSINIQDLCIFDEYSSNLPNDSVILGTKYNQGTSQHNWKTIEEAIYPRKT